MGKIIAMEFGADHLRLIDQRKLPKEYTVFECATYQDCIFAIKDMVVRGAPAIGAAAAYGVVMAAKQFAGLAESEFRKRMELAIDELSAARPTAVNLMWAMDRMRRSLNAAIGGTNESIWLASRKEADAIIAEEIDRSERVSSFGNALVPDNATILTHCNTGSLAVPGPGTALGIIRAAHRSGKGIAVYADETRPRLQGARLTAWELLEEGIPVTLIADSVAATLIRDRRIDLVIVGADRIATNGDTANKIGTFMLSVISKHYGVPFYIAAPISTIDFGCAGGDHIVIEERGPEEVTHIDGIQVAPQGVHVYNPAFDVTPAENISGIVTEQGVLYPPFVDAIARLGH